MAFFSRIKNLTRVNILSSKTTISVPGKKMDVKIDVLQLKNSVRFTP